MNEAMFPAMERQMERLFVAKMGELKLQLKAEMEQEMRAEIEAKVRQELAVTKQQMKEEIREELKTEMKEEIDEKIGEAKTESKIELEQHVEDKIDEKQGELKDKLESEMKEVISNEVAEQKDIVKEELTTEAANEKVIFAAVRSESGNVEGNSVITYDTLTANLGEAMDISTGAFTAPKNGLYAFTFSAAAHETKAGHVEVEVLKNGAGQFFIDDGNADHKPNTKERNISFYWMFDLAENDTVKLKVSAGTVGLHADECCDRVYFTGQFLNAT